MASEKDLKGSGNDVRSKTYERIKQRKKSLQRPKKPRKTTPLLFPYCR